MNFFLVTLTSLTSHPSEHARFKMGDLVTLNHLLAGTGYCAVATFILLKILDAVMGLRVSQEGEVRGLDMNEHGEEGYIFV